ncbi:MAG: efflux RND transporter periplasmic adaptor subunit [Planctomycetes bacterium]|nr:efflux RND transporter periplasmic adaptor subunit [Planctomycetota bacterium]
MAQLDCPNNQTLRNYLLGKCSDVLSVEIEGHLSHCSECEATISQFDSADDTLLRHLPLAPAAATSEPEDPPGWIHELRQEPPAEGGGDMRPDNLGRIPSTAEVHEMPPLPDGCANYELLGVLGRGGMGVVFLARHRQLNRRVALKVVRPDALSSREARQMFQREIQILGQLNHPGIVMATDAGTVASGAYLVMELIEGADLGRVVREGGPLTVEAACAVGRQVAEALAAAHGSGAIHRDVKPSNIMVDLNGRARLLDFGLAHMTLMMQHSGDTSVGRLLGTLDYMAPEQAGGQCPVDSRADLYSLGATLFFLLTGRPPHGSRKGRSMLEQIRAISHEDAVPVSSIRVDVPIELDRLVASLLCRDPERRPLSAADVAAVLARWAGGNLGTRVADLVPRLPIAEQTAADSVAARQSFVALLGTEALGPASTAAPPAVRPVRGRFWGKWTALAAWAGIVLGGVTIWLKTSQGTLKIESEVGDVTVEAIDERNQVRELQIKQGNNETILETGTYRVRLAGTHDGIALDRDVIRLHRGDATVAKILRVADDAGADRPEGHRQIRIANPERKNVTIREKFVCQIQSHRHIKVRALERGYLEEIHLKEGQMVKKGDLLFKITPIILQARLDVELAEQQHAQLQYDATKRLFDHNVVSAGELGLHAANLKKAEAKVAEARAELNFASVRAPFDGLIGRLQQQQGSLSNAGDELTTLSDNSLMWVYFHVPEARYLEFMSDVNQPREDLQIELVLANGRKYQQAGKISAIESDFDHEKGSIAFRADFPNPDRLLRHGQAGTVSISRELKDAIVIPQQATFEILQKRYVYVIDKDHVAHRREIVVQNELDDRLVVKQGLDAGDTLVVDGIRQVRDGGKVDLGDGATP